MNSLIVALIALVISALEVYGKQIFKTALKVGLAIQVVRRTEFNRLLVMLGHFLGSVDEREDVFGNEISLAEHPDTRAVSIK